MPPSLTLASTASSTTGARRCWPTWTRPCRNALPVGPPSWPGSAARNWRRARPPTAITTCTPFSAATGTRATSFPAPVVAAAPPMPCPTMARIPTFTGPPKAATTSKAANSSAALPTPTARLKCALPWPAPTPKKTTPKAVPNTSFRPPSRPWRAASSCNGNGARRPTQKSNATKPKALPAARKKATKTAISPPTAIRCRTACSMPGSRVMTSRARAPLPA